MDDKKVLLTILSISDILAWWPDVEVWIKIISVLVTFVVGVFACWSYWTNIKLKRTENKIREQEYDRMKAENLERYRPR